MSLIYSILSYLDTKTASTPKRGSKTAAKKSSSSRVEKNVARSPTARAAARRKSLESAAAKKRPWDPKPDVDKVLAILDNILTNLEIYEIRNMRNFINTWAMRTLSKSPAGSGFFESFSPFTSTTRKALRWDAKDEVDQVIAILDRILSKGEVSEIRVARNYLSNWAIRTCYAIYNIEDA